MPTISFPVTIRVSIEVPEFLAPQVAETADARAWQFTAAYENGPEQRSLDEDFADVLSRINVPAPQVTTESEVGGQRLEVGDQRSEFGGQKSEFEGQRLESNAMGGQDTASPAPAAAATPIPKAPFWLRADHPWAVAAKASAGGPAVPRSPLAGIQQEPVAETAPPTAGPAQAIWPPPPSSSNNSDAPTGQAAETTLDGQKISPEQQTAIELMLCGATIAKVAQTVGVHPNTVHRWKREDVNFRAVLNAQRNDYHEAARSKLQHLSNHVAYVLSNEVAGGNFRAALQVAKGLGLLTGKPPEPDEERAEQIKEVDLAQARAKAAETEAANWLTPSPQRKSKTAARKSKGQRLAEKFARRQERLKGIAEMLRRFGEETSAAAATMADGSGI